MSGPAPKRTRGSRVLVLVLVLLAAAAGVYAGARWHARIAPRLGIEAAEAPVPHTGQLWTCSMHPQVIRSEPGLCPICHMQLTPLAAGASATGEVTIDPTVVQNMGLRVATVTEGPLHRTLRLFGTLQEAQPSIRDVNLRVSGWIRRLHVEAEGQRIEAGDPLFDLYSPELQVGIEELIAARATTAGAGPEAEGTAARAFRDAAVHKLELLGLSRAQIDALAQQGRAPETVTFTSPISGHVTRKPVVEGSAVRAGDDVLRIVDHSVLWLDAQVFEQDLPFVAVGQAAAVALTARPGARVRGAIEFIHPHVDEMTRTGLVRVSVPNPDMVLKPGMFATVQLDAEIAERALAVPREAVLDTGTAQRVFVVQHDGHFLPRDVRMGASADGGLVQILEGLAAGETVVTSGQFLLDSESRTREAVEKFRDAKR